MKILNFKLIFLSILISLAANAQNPDKADEVTKTIQAQAQVTTERLKSLVQQMGNLAGTPYADESYKPLAADFGRRIDQALSQFDQSIKTTILPKSQYWLNRFSTYAVDLTSNQDLLSNLRVDTVTQLNGVSAEYQRAILSIFHLVLGDVPLFYTFETERFSKGVSKNFCGMDLPLKGSIDKRRLWGRKIRISTVSWNQTIPQEPERTICEIFVSDESDKYNYGSYNSFNGTSYAFHGGKYQRIKKSVDDPLDIHDVESFEALLSTAPYRMSALAHINLVNEFEDTLLEKWTKGCETLICKQLRLADHLQFLSVAISTINVNIRFSLPNRHAFALAAKLINVRALQAVGRKLSEKLAKEGLQ